MLEFPESDWKLFRKRIVVWQKGHMEKLNREYAAILAGNNKVRLQSHIHELTARSEE